VDNNKQKQGLVFGRARSIEYSVSEGGKAKNIEKDIIREFKLGSLYLSIAFPPLLCTMDILDGVSVQSLNLIV
jgi:hypothetical protein